MSQFFLMVAILGLVTAPFLIWRANMAMNDPEKYKRLRAFDKEMEEHFQRRMQPSVKVAKATANVGLKAGGLLLRLLLKK